MILARCPKLAAERVYASLRVCHEAACIRSMRLRAEAEPASDSCPVCPVSPVYPSDNHITCRPAAPTSVWLHQVEMTQPQPHRQKTLGRGRATMMLAASSGLLLLIMSLHISPALAEGPSVPHASHRLLIVLPVIHNQVHCAIW